MAGALAPAHSFTKALTKINTYKTVSGSGGGLRRGRGSRVSVKLFSCPDGEVFIFLNIRD